MADSKLRVLPLGGLGEIGKNMTVVEYDGAIVVVDVGLRFPTICVRPGTPNAAAIASTVMSSCVGPIPPVVNR